VSTAIDHVTPSVGRGTLRPSLHRRAAAALGDEARHTAERPASHAEPAAVSLHALVAPKLRRARLNDATLSLQPPNPTISVLRVSRPHPGITGRGITTIGALIARNGPWHPKVICSTRHLPDPSGLPRDTASQVPNSITATRRHARASRGRLGKPIGLVISCAVNCRQQRSVAQRGDTDVALSRVRWHPQNIDILLCIPRSAQSSPNVG
jgi:hypothetical protein